LPKPEITLYRGDIPTGLTLAATVAVDTESMGLNPMRDRLCLVQLSAGGGIEPSGANPSIVTNSIAVKDKSS
jgi:ribonuclease D